MIERVDWRSVAVRGLAALAFGIVALVWPDLTLRVLVLLFGAFVLVDGVASIASVVRSDPATRPHRAGFLVRGILGAVVGVVTLVWPDVTALALLWLIAAWAIATGIMELVTVIRLRAELEGEWLLALSGVASLLFGLILAITPGAGALVITWLIGWFGVIAGVILLVAAWRLRSLEHGAIVPPGAKFA